MGGTGRSGTSGNDDLSWSLIRVSPIGNPLSSVLKPQNRRSAASLQGIIDAISQVHGTPPGMPRIVVKLLDTLPAGVQARILPGQTTIEISSNSKIRALSLVHEVGHMVDFWGAGQGVELWSRRTPAASIVIQAFATTWAAQQLLSRPHNAHVRYLAEPEEIWARTYAQYVAVMSGNPRLLRELRIRMKASEQMDYPYTFNDDDFAAMARAMTKDMENFGWLQIER